MTKQEISSNKAPKAIGPYSQAIKLGNFVFCSGQIGLDPASGEYKDKDIGSQTNQIFENLRAILREAGCSFADVVKVTVYLKNMADFTKMNEIYANYFNKPFPARATVEVSRLPKDTLVEIECIAYVDG